MISIDSDQVKQINQVDNFNIKSSLIDSEQGEE